MVLMDIFIIICIFYSIGFLIMFSDVEKENRETIKEFDRLNSTTNFKGLPTEPNDSLNYIDSAMFLSMDDWLIMKECIADYTYKEIEEKFNHERNLLLLLLGGSEWLIYIIVSLL